MAIDKEERKLKKVKIALMRNPEFAMWSGILMVGKTSIIDDIPTAATNGRDEFYGREFVKIINEKELAFVVLHEAMHKAYRHLTTWVKLWKEDAQLANMACDYVINIQLKDLDPKGVHLKFPVLGGKQIGLVDEKYRGMNAKQVFDLLKQDKKDGKGMFGGGGSGADSLDEHNWGEAEGLSDAEKRELEKEVDQALRQGAMAHKKLKGEGAGGLSRELQEMLEPKVNWREVLREYVKSICKGKDSSSWRRVNRRFLSGDTYMPTLISEKVGHLVIGVDTSGSIGGQELAAFLSEVKGIADEVTPDKVDLLYWDGEVAGHEEYDATSMGSLVESTKPKGGGGTSPSCITRYLKEKNIKPECSIILTDGYVGNDWGGDWESPVLWVICGGNTVTSPVGQTIHIND
jgi:predicted metal-dependent peptidase